MLHMLAADSLAIILGAIGTVSGLSGLVAAVVATLTYRRERPRLVIDFAVLRRPGGGALEVTVANDGPHAIALVDVVVGAGVEGEGRVMFRRLRQARRSTAKQDPAHPEEWLGVGMDIGTLDEPILLAAGEPKVVEFSADQLLFVGGLEELTVAAWDVAGRVVRRKVPKEMRDRLPRARVRIRPVDES
jgi:hypothetical protein